MPFNIGQDFSHIPNVPYSTGPSTGFGEAFLSGVGRSAGPESELGFRTDVRNAYQDNLKALNVYLGQDTPPDHTIGLDSIAAAIGRDSGVEQAPSLAGFGTGLPSGNPRDVQQGALAQIDKTDEQIRKLREQAQQQGIDFNVKTFKEILQEQAQKRQDQLDQMNGVASRAHGWSALSNWAGGMVGFMNPTTNPLMFGTAFIPLGGPEASIVTKMVRESLFFGGVMGAHDVMYASPQAKVFNEPQPNVLGDMLAAGLAAGVIRGGLELAPGAAKGAFRAAEARINPNRAAARAISDTIEQALGRPIDTSVLRLTDAELRTAVENLPPSTARNMAEHTLSTEAMSAKASPFPNDRGGRIATDAAINKVARALENGTLGDTAIGRTLRPDMTPSADGIVPKTPQEAYARAERPDLFTQKTALDAQVVKAQERLTTAESALTDTKLGDMVGAFDKQAGDRINTLESDLSRAATSEQRAAIEGELNKIVEGLSIGDTGKAVADNFKALRAEIANARNDLRPLREASQRVNQQVNDLGQSLLDRARVEARVRAPDAVVSPTDLERIAADTADKPELVQKVTDRVLEEAGLKVEVRAPEGVPIKPVEIPKTVDILGERIDTSIDVPVGEGQTKTVAEVLQEIADEDALMTATRNATLPNCGA